ncbi:hypothetical protein GUITHDRAFT_132115 [Guillardia theta CCMP2712]|uniref:E2F/DP family winged-helix DNA-binding domain-containing protein n=2 Tax=Guillardia theta TaxID=55529 RepID=L1K1E3_GUITC|nr:hypothetical protein GUITHDRAFT_132115 [Guillardia theta CCMP2712]EKX54369.1 hypothetical protein GUITHDRAFT_132115 [Guillardia theta CCMP2712]|eukprot:XP_005841349.1 hypothetical protein GUITHDRAFT_132115 [Guillardia theta CCMP2712]
MSGSRSHFDELHDDALGPSSAAEEFQDVFQELGLDPYVTTLGLTQENPTMRQLANATQANAVSGLIELAKLPRDDQDNDLGSPSKRYRMDPSDDNKATPVRQRANNKPRKKRGTQCDKLKIEKNSNRKHNGSQNHVAEVPRTPDQSRNYPAEESSSNFLNRLNIPENSVSDRERKNQGLRHFSARVCRSVEAKVSTTYNDVAEELVNEFKESNCADYGDDKNIRRRAYDALNVLTAMGIISKDKRDIKWKGFPPMKSENGSNSNPALSKERSRLLQEIENKKKEVEDKNTLVRDLATQFVSLKRLLSRNELTEHEPCHQKKIYLPFVIVNTDMDNSVVCEISQDEKFAEINCTKPFKLYDDRGTLSKMQLHLCSESELNQILPNPGLVPFVQTMQNKTNCGVENLAQNKTCIAREDDFKTSGCEKMSDDDVDGVHDDLDDDVDAEEDDS